MKSQRNHARLRRERKRPACNKRAVVLILALVGLIGTAALMLGPARLASAQVVAPSWTYTGNLNTARAAHTATLLPNGKILVAGGYNFNPNDPVNSAELYDPLTGTWTGTGNLNGARDGHTATLLANGKVLVAGGYSGSQSLNNSAELYDPATGTWSVTGNLGTARNYGHTATRLRNGKVLVTGGVGDCDPNRGCFALTSAEVYDPATGTWGSTGNLNTARFGHTATLLPTNGKVLVGEGDNVELYDPATGTWSIAFNPEPASVGSTATLLPNGKVLIAGGHDLDCSGFCPRNTAALFDPLTGTWTSTGTLNLARDGHTATLLPGGKVLVAGPGDSAELYDPTTGTWSITASLNVARSANTATLLSNGKLLVVGGNVFGGPGTLNSAELYDPGTANAIDDAQFFVRQHYRDFLNRDPDPDGLAFWTNQITSCGADAQCLELKRINVSAAFFVSIEFQETGYFVYRVNKAAHGNLSGLPIPLTLNTFQGQVLQVGNGVVVGQPGWEQVLEMNKQLFLGELDGETDYFTSAYPTSMSPAEFVDTLFANAEVTPSASDRTTAINEFGSATTSSDLVTRARVLRRVAENSTLKQQEFNRAFVLMQYFGYLRRNPNDPPEPGLNFDGYNFWLNKLNQFHGNFVNAEMVKAFLLSGEYRQRFGL